MNPFIEGWLGGLVPANEEGEHLMTVTTFIGNLME